MVLLLLIRCWMLLPLCDSAIVLCFIVRWFVSILVLQSSWSGRESWLLCYFVLMVSRDCCVALPHGAMSLSAVCDCGISWSYLLTISQLYTRILYSAFWFAVSFFFFVKSYVMICSSLVTEVYQKGRHEALKVQPKFLSCNECHFLLSTPPPPPQFSYCKRKLC